MHLWRRAGRRRDPRPGSRTVLLPAAHLLLVGGGILSALCPTPAPAKVAAVEQAEAAPASQVRARATWDDTYLYFAFQVDDSSVIGTNTAPLSHPELDDSIAVYLQTGDARPKAPNNDTHAMLVSAAGGFTFLHGDTAKQAFVVQPLFTIKYAVTVQGSLNRTDDHDKGYTVEMAIPLQTLGLDGKTITPGTVLGINIVARGRDGRPPLTAIAPEVRTEADVPTPSKWVKLVLVNPDGTGGGAASAGTIVSPRVNDKSPSAAPPLIDGVFRIGEWPETSKFTFAAPGDKPTSTTNVAPTPTSEQAAANAALAAQEADRDATAPALPLDHGLNGLSRRIFARYSLAYQGDLRKSIPPRGVLAADGRFTLRDQPLTGAGPWFTTDRAGWHRSQLLEMQHAGIDVALTEMSGPNGATGPGDEKALLVLVTALRDLQVENQTTPQLALYLNTSTLSGEGAKIDLATPEGRTVLYNAIRRWMLIVTPDLRNRISFAPPATGAATAAYPIFLSDGSAFTGLDNPDWANDLRDRFAKEFGAAAGGATLLFIGGAHFNAPGATTSLAAVVPAGESGPGTGAIPCYVIQPGYAKEGATLVARRDLATYREAWEKALTAQPAWFIVDSWNDFTRGTEVCSSRQYGTRYADETRIYSVQIGGMKKHDLRWLRQNAPRRMRPGDIVQTEVTVQNSGTTPLRDADRIVLTYRWKQDGKVVAESPIHLPLAGTLRPTQTASLALGLGAVRLTSDGKLEPLAAGDYTVEIDMATETPDGRSVSFFSDEGSTALTVPVTVTDQIAQGVQFESTTAPRLLQAGGTYPVLVKVRWTGTEPLPAGSASLLCQIQSNSGQSTLGSSTIPLDRPLVPGQWITLVAPLSVVDSGGQPLGVANPETAARGAGDDSCRLRWLLTRTGEVAAVPGEYIERVAVYPGDPEARFVTPIDVPTALDANSLVPITVRVTNRGVTDWAKDAYGIGCHWYFPDGIEAKWNPAVTIHLDKAVKQGATTQITVPVRCPDRDGEYVLAFDVVKLPATYLSTLPVSRTADIGLARVRITGGRLTFVDLTRWYNVDGVATDAAPADGDLDGAGNTLPAESFPPDLFGLAAQVAPTTRPGKKPVAPKWETIPAYPSSYYVDASPSSRLTSFRYGSDTDGLQNVVRCDGQKIEIPRGTYVGLHLAAAATGGTARPLTLILDYGGGKTETVTRDVADWHTPPAPRGDPLALLVHTTRNKDGDKAMDGVLRHIIIPVNAARPLQSITLPKDDALKVFAITLEK